MHLYPVQRVLNLRVVFHHLFKKYVLILYCARLQCESWCPSTQCFTVRWYWYGIWKCIMAHKFDFFISLHGLMISSDVHNHHKPGGTWVCETYECALTYFKCPGYYCIPWRLVCNNVWDCPGGTDEMMNCSRTSCPGQFKCHDTSICLAPDNVCNRYPDCMLGDDEYFCSLNISACPQNCTCIVFSISCQNVTYNYDSNFTPYLNVHISMSIRVSHKEMFTLAV